MRSQKFLIYCLAVFLTFSLSYSQQKAAKTALVLSGGGARGFAHIGVLKALEEAGVYPDIIVGTSMGAIIASLYACGNSPDNIAAFLGSTNWRNIFGQERYREVEFISQKIDEIPTLFSLYIDENLNIIYPRSLLSNQGMIERLFEKTIEPEYYAKANFDSLNIPLRIVATDIKTGEMKVFRKGSLSQLVSGSSAFPIILSPLAYEDMLLVDGGITNNVPCDVALDNGADFIIAVDMSSKKKQLSSSVAPLEYMGQTVNVMAFFSDTRNLHLADVLITPEADHLFSTSFDSIDELIEIGYKATISKIDLIKSQTPIHDFWNSTFSQKVSVTMSNLIIRDIKFKNNSQTKNYIIRRELALKKGDKWNLNKARQSIKNAYSTGLFNTVALSLVPIAKDTADLLVIVNEKERVKLSFGMNFNSETDAKALISAHYYNILGRGFNIKSYTIASDIHKKLSIDVAIPRIFTTTLTSYLSAYVNDEKVPFYQDFEKITSGHYSQYGIMGSAGVQIRRAGLTSIGLKYDYYDIAETNTPVMNIQAQLQRISRFFIRIYVDNTNDYDLPTSGRLNDLNFEQSLTTDELSSYAKVSVSTVSYETLRNKYTVSTTLNFGYLSTSIHPYEKFRLGGVNSFPGYHIDQRWGNLLLSMGMGIRIPLTNNSYLQCNGIFGNVWDNIETFNWLEMEFGAKAGLLITTPLGPISIDYGFNSDKCRIFYFNFGHYF